MSSSKKVILDKEELVNCGSDDDDHQSTSVQTPAINQQPERPPRRRPHSLTPMRRPATPTLPNLPAPLAGGLHGEEALSPPLTAFGDGREAASYSPERSVTASRRPSSRSRSCSGVRPSGSQPARARRRAASQPARVRQLRINNCETTPGGRLVEIEVELEKIDST